MRTLIVFAAALLTPAAAAAHSGHVAAPGTVHHITQHAGGPNYLLGLALVGLLALAIGVRAIRSRR